MRNVLVTTYEFGMGGIERYLFSHFQKMNTNLVNIIYVYGKGSETTAAMEGLFISIGVRVVAAEDGRWGYIKALYRLSGEGGFDVIHVNGQNWVLLIGAVIGALRHIPTRIVHSHSDVRKPAGWYKLYCLVCGLLCSLFATHRFACSSLTACSQYGRKAYENGGVEVRKNALDVSAFRFNLQTRRQIRAKLGIGEGVFVVGHVGRFSQEKNHAFLLDVFAELRKRIPDARLVFVGWGDTLEQVRSKVDEMGLIGACIFAGASNQPQQYYQAFDVFVFPSIFEGLGIVTIEAQAAGLHCVVSDAVPQDARLTDLVVYLPLAEGHCVWAEQIARFAREYERTYPYARINAAGYNIKEAARLLFETYNAGCRG